MKKLMMFILLSFSLVVSAKPSKSVKSPKGKTKTALTCPRIAGEAKRIPFKELKVSKKEKLLICVNPDTLTVENLATQYDGYLFTQGDKKPKRALVGSLSVPVDFETKKKTVYEIRHLKLRDNHYPLYREKVVCEKSACKRTDRVWVFNQYELSPPSPKDLEREKIIFAKAKSGVQELTEADLSQMAILALSGRKLANEFFAMPIEERVRMSARPLYQQMHSLITRIKTEGHLKVAGK